MGPSVRGLLALAALFGSALPAQSWAVEFQNYSAGHAVELPHHPAMLTQKEVTIEAWVKSGAPCEFHVFQRYAASAEHKALFVLRDGSISLRYAGSPWLSTGPVTDPNRFPFDGQWHHLAFVRHADDRYAVFVDGTPVLMGGPGPCWQTCAIVGTTTPTLFAYTSGSFAMAKLRVSSAARYTQAFAPATRWDSDARTVLLLLFDEGQGNQLHDSSPSGQVGVIRSAAYLYRWIEGPTHPATSVPFGPSCRGSAGAPDLQAWSGLRPRLGQLWTVTAAPLTPGRAVFVALGLSDSQAGAVRLPYDLSHLGMTGCQLLQSGELAFQAANPIGVIHWSMAIPNGPWLAGGRFFVQVYALDPAANPAGLVTSNGLAATVGY